MSNSEILRLVIAGILVIVVIARRMGLFDWIQEGKKKKAKAAKVQAMKDRRKEQVEAQQRRIEQKKRETAEIRRQSLGGLQQKSVSVAGMDLWYAEGGKRGQGETLVLLHGFASDKEGWRFIVPSLVEQFHILAPDLPGFGQNEKKSDVSYDVTTQAKRIRSFLQKVGVERFHLVGHSMGASIAAVIACAMPREVRSLTLVEPFCVRVPYKTALDEMLANGRNPLVIAAPAAYDNLLGFLYVQPPEIPENLKKIRAEQLAEHRTFLLDVWQQVRGGERAHFLDVILPETRVRTLVIQGAESQVVHPATAQAIPSIMPRARGVLIEGCGHMAMIEKPQETVQHILEHMRAVASQQTTGAVPTVHPMAVVTEPTQPIPAVQLTAQPAPQTVQPQTVQPQAAQPQTVQPATPQPPVQSMPAQPQVPAQPVAPVQPAAPQPTVQSIPAQAQVPVAPVQPAAPQPTVQSMPVQPQVPVQPVAPVQPAAPQPPAQSIPAQPQVPMQPQVPVQAQVPAQAQGSQPIQSQPVQPQSQPPQPQPPQPTSPKTTA